MALSGKSVIRTKIKVEGAKKSATDVKGFTDKLKGLTDISKGSAAGLAAFGPHAAAAAAGIAAIGAAAAIATKALTAMAQAFVHLGQRGGEFAAIVDGYERIADQGMIARLQELSGWHIQQRDIMVAYTRATETGVISQEQFAEALDLITTRAQQTGESASAMLERMIPLLQGRGIEQITDLGVQSGVLNDRLKEMKTSAESAEGQTERLRIGLELAREQIGETDNSVSNLSDSWEAMDTNTQDYLDNMAEVVSTSPALVDAFEALREGMNNVGVSAESSGALVAGFMQTVIASTAEAVIRVSTLIERYLEFVKTAGETLGINVRRHGLTAAQQAVEQILATATAVQRAAISGAVVAPGGDEEEELRRRRRRPRGTGGGGAGDDAAEEARLRQEALDLRLDTMEREQYIEEQLQQWRIDNVREISDARLALAETMRGIDEETMEREQEVADFRLRKSEELAAQEAEADEARAERQEGIFSNLSSVAGSTNTIFKSISATIGALGGDTEEQAKREGKFLVAFSGVMAAVELAQSIADFASLDFYGGAAHLAASAAFVASAAMAASDLGGGTAKAPASGGTFTPAAPERAMTPAADGGGVTIVENYSLGRSEADMGETMRNADWAFESSGGVSNRGLAAQFGA